MTYPEEFHISVADEMAYRHEVPLSSNEIELRATQPTWTLAECIALFFGWKPNDYILSWVQAEREKGKSFDATRHLFGEIEAEQQRGRLDFPISSRDFIRWALLFEPVPGFSPFPEVIRNDYLAYAQTFEGLRSENRELQKSLSEQKSGGNQRKIRSLQKICAALAIRGLKFKNGESYVQVSAQIRILLEACKCEDVDISQIEKYLRDGFRGLQADLEGGDPAVALVSEKTNRKLKSTEFSGG